MFSLGLIFAYVVSEGQHPFGGDTKEASHNILSEESPKMNSMKYESCKFHSLYCSYIKLDMGLYLYNSFQ